jgi:hypothetical protein
MSDVRKTARLYTLRGTRVPEHFLVSTHILSLRGERVSHVSTERPSAGADVSPRRFAPRGKFSFMRALATVALVIGLSLSSLGLFLVGDTVSYFSDFEFSLGNLFRAGSLDFLVADATYARTITATTTPLIIPIMTPESESLDILYRVFTEPVGATTTTLCTRINLTATTSPFIYSGPLLGATTTATTTVGAWQIGLTLGTTTGLTNGDTCSVDLVYRGWHPQALEYTGFTDEERVRLNLTYEATANVFDIVLNEFLPNPDVSANGLNMGTDSDDLPFGEWVELYNKGDVPQDLSGWYISDASGGLGNLQALISSTNTIPATTTIPAHGWLVVYFNKPVLNNTGDSIFLYTNGNVLVDFYSYGDPSDYCENEPSPAISNATSSPSGTPGNGRGADCVANQVAPNKSYARIPDGTGAFVDPIPTPGFANIPDPVVEEPVEEIPVATTTAPENSGGGSTGESLELEAEPASDPTESATSTPPVEEGGEEPTDETASSTPETETPEGEQELSETPPTEEPTGTTTEQTTETPAPEEVTIPEGEAVPEEAPVEEPDEETQPEAEADFESGTEAVPAPEETTS